MNDNETPQSMLSGLEGCTLHRRTPYGMASVSMSQLSIARHYGGIKYKGDDYTYFPVSDELVRDDVLKWKTAESIEQETSQASFNL